MTAMRWGFLVAACAGWLACGTTSGGSDAGNDSGVHDAGNHDDAGVPDAGTQDGGNPQDAGTQDAGTQDAGSPQDAGSQDAGFSTACINYCACMSTHCPNTSPAGANCLTDCAAQTTWDLGCRTTHCNNAAGGATTHCPHAGGVSICQ